MTDSRAIEIELLEEERRRLEATPIGARLAKVYQALAMHRDSRPYDGLGPTAAALLLLEETGRPMTTPEMASALIAGGLVTTAKRFGATLYATLTNSAAFARIGTGRSATWTLATWRMKQAA
jgi:hypothetical protein